MTHDHDLHDLHAAVMAYEGTAVVAYVHDGELKIHGNTNRGELAELLERAAGVLRAAGDPDATTLG